MNRRALIGSGCAALADAARAASPTPFLALKAPVRIPLASLSAPWAPETFKARFTKSDGADSVAPGIAVRTPRGVKALCAYCPHELCVIRFDGDTRRLRCPCHFSLFDPGRDGAFISGPALRPTYRFEYTVGPVDVVVTGIEADLERRLL